ncbi:hypothetical protein HGRIS_000346 [Hohenbuehelia grisea]|uniref:G-protein coupled receptors family 2 profile 2 domain-containing protein n=1 Tax=Hohenbuehelia grisea TaxID=104357 RepID=A0ABR3JSP9_9AGAR
MFQPRNATSDDGPGIPSIAISFGVLQFVGGLALSGILCTVLFAQNVKRSMTWISFCIAWIFSCISFNLLFFAGQQTGPIEPNFGLCVVQGALIHSVPVLQAAVSLALVIHTWAFVQSTVTGHPYLSRRTNLIFLLIFPWVLSLSLFVGFLVFGIQNPSTVHREKTGSYCNIFYKRIPSKVTSGTAGVLVLISLIFEVSLGRILYRHWRLLSGKAAYLTMAIRVMTFTFVGALVLCLAIVYFASRARSEILLAIIPIIAVVVFGTQADLRRAWMFWKNAPPPVPVKGENKVTQSQSIV